MKKLVVVLFLGFTSNIQAQDYDAYSNAVTGSSRIIGLGGAYHAESAGIEGAFFNPAGIATMESWWDGTFSFGSFRQKFQGSDQSQRFKSSNLTYFYTGLVFKKKDWRDFSFGLAVSSPASQNFSGDISSNSGQLESVDYEFNKTEVSLPVALRLIDKFYFGANLKISAAKMRFRSDSNPSFVESDVVGTGLDLGFLYIPQDKLRFGLTYSVAETLKFEEQRNSSIQGFDPFRQARSPHRLFLGSAYQAFPRWKLFADLGLIIATDDSLLPGSALSTNVARVRSGQDNSLQYHIGVEHLLEPKVWHARLGHYFQPARAEGDIDRYHVTGGIDYFFWYLRVGTFFDLARDYFNVGLGLSPSFSHRTDES